MRTVYSVRSVSHSHAAEHCVQELWASRSHPPGKGRIIGTTSRYDLRSLLRSLKRRMLIRTYTRIETKAKRAFLGYIEVYVLRIRSRHTRDLTVVGLPRRVGTLGMGGPSGRAIMEK